MIETAFAGVGSCTLSSDLNQAKAGNIRMPSQTKRAVLLSRALLSALIAGAPTVAIAQAAPDPPTVISPLKSDPDPNGVNIRDGKKILDLPVVLSVPADPRLTFDRVQNSAPYILGTLPVNAPGTSSWSAHVGADTSESFQCTNDDQCSSVKYTGADFTFAGRNVRLPGSGALYVFNDVQSVIATPGVKTVEQRYASSVQYPDGEQIGYVYEADAVPGYQLCGTPAVANCEGLLRPTRISSNTGYYITIAYQYAGSDPTQPGWGTPAEAAIYSPAGTLIRRLDYSGSSTIIDYGNGATNVGGRTFTVVGLNNALGASLEGTGGSVTLPGEASAELSVAGSSSHGTSTAPLIDSVARDGVAWTYSYANAHDGVVSGVTAPLWDSLSIVGPNGYSVTYTVDSNGSYPHPIHSRTESVTSTTTRTTSFTYDYTRGDRLIGVTMPEGNAVNLVYDDCGNILQKTTVPKAGSGLSSLTESATYPAVGLPNDLCPSVLNYRATTYTDALSRITNYSWNSVGQLTQQLDPPDANGIRRETDITYSSGALSRKTLARVCGNTTSCAGNAESHTEYTYFGNTFLPATVTAKDEATAATRTTTYTYDLAGRPTVIDGPLAGTDDAKYFQYDTYGRKIWEVGERGPNGLRLAKKYTYRDSDDKVTSVQTGTVTCTSACDTAALTLTLLQQTDTTYDSRRYAIRETTYKGSTTDSVTDASFLDRGVAECTAVRMNFSALPAAASHGACSLGTQGSQGADRITLNSYDNAGELTLVQKAYGTSIQANYAAYTYTLNGKQQTVTDADGNKAQFVYDGLDRLSQWQFPSKTTAGQVNTADYEQYTYDGVGNRTCFRKRDGSKLTYTFDGLNRMASKIVVATSGGSCP